LKYLSQVVSIIGELNCSYMLELIEPDVLASVVHELRLVFGEGWKEKGTTLTVRSGLGDKLIDVIMSHQARHVQLIT
jgi:hypothetical protein